MRTLILGLFALHFIFLAYFNNVYVAGLPVRSFLILLAGGLVVMRDYGTLFRIGLVSKVYLLLGIVGLLVSLANNVTPGNIANGELKLLQSYLMVLVAFFVVEQFGFRTLGYLVVGIALPSALVGILQGLDVQLAWKLQSGLLSIQNKELSDEIRSQMTEALSRPPGLSLYAIPQTYMLLGALMINLYLVLQNRYNPRFHGGSCGGRDSDRGDFCLGNAFGNGGGVADACADLRDSVSCPGDSGDGVIGAVGGSSRDCDGG